MYSEMIGSFIRTGNYPLEANYIFNTKQELLEFYADPVNKTTLHEGLFRIVKSDEEQQTLYWVVREGDELVFKKLVSGNVLDLIKAVDAKIDEEIQRRQEAILALWGTNDPQEIPSDLNSIYDLAQAFQNAVLPDLDELLAKILGDPIPSENFRTFRGVEDAIIALKTYAAQGFHNLQTELDQTQVGIGLSGDGGFNSDQETIYLKNATSIMHALRILDGQINAIIQAGVSLNWHDV